MISKYNDFILDKQFELIIKEHLSLLDKNTQKLEKRTDWDYTEIDEKPEIFEWDLKNNNKITPKLKYFLSNLPKEKIKKYFYTFLKKIKNMPKNIRKKLTITYSLVFLTFVSLSYLIPDETDKNTPSEVTDLVIEFEEEIKEVKSKLKENEEGSELKENELKNRKSEFKKAQKIVKEVESGYSSDKKDRGNYVNTPYGKRFLGTNHGISAPILSDYMGKLPTKKDMENLSYETALNIFKNIYWNPQNLSYFSDQNIANILYDGCVNQGINGTKKVLRKVYRNNNIEISDKENPFNKSFIDKVNKINNQEKIFNEIKQQRGKRYKSSITYKIHGKGWLSRLFKFKYDELKNY